MKISDTKKLAAITAAFFITVTAFSGCSENASSSQAASSVSQAAKSDIDASIAAEDIDVGYDEESTVGITFSDGSATIDGEGAVAEGETVTISQAGTYILSGMAANGRIIVAADKKAEVKLIFNGLDITCSDNAPLLVSKAKKVYIVLEDGTENVLTDGASYSLGEDDSNTDGAIFSKADLTINGSGTLTACGAVGMEEGFGDSSTQYSVLLTFVVSIRKKRPSHKGTVFSKQFSFGFAD